MAEFVAWTRNNPNAPVRADGRRYWGYPSRKSPLSGVIVIHSTEGLPDRDGHDLGAENTGQYLTRSERPASYHSIVDSDSIVDWLPATATAFHCATGHLNSHSFSISAATQAHTWGQDTAFDNAVIRNMARRAARFMLDDMGWPTAIALSCVRRVTFDQAAARVPGFVTHGEADPGRRSDPWTRHPLAASLWDRLFAYLRQEITGHPAPPQEDDFMAQASREEIDAMLRGSADAGEAKKAATAAADRAAKTLAQAALNQKEVWLAERLVVGALVPLAKAGLIKPRDIPVEVRKKARVLHEREPGEGYDALLLGPES